MRYERYKRFHNPLEEEHQEHHHCCCHEKDKEKEKEKEKDKEEEICICEVVKKIHEAQEAVVQNDCKVSCGNSIQQILSPTAKPSANTIPFSLDGGDTFFGKAPVYDNKGNFCIISSPFFKVKKVDKNCCAVLELLWPTHDDEPFEGNFKEDGKHCFPCFKFDGFIGTGACITVDLKCFCSIACHKATMVHEATSYEIHDIFKGHKHPKFGYC